jgi:phage-related protein
MAIGFNTTSAYGSLSVLPDRGMTRSAKQKTRSIKFGDGYEQRSTKGINNTEETYNVSFKNRPKQDIDNIAGFLNSLNGVSSFNFTVPDFATTEEVTGVLDSSIDNEKTIKVVCDTFSQSYNNSGHNNLSATFRRVYES